MSKTGSPEKPEEISSADTLNNLSKKLDEEKNSLDGNRTAKMGLQYLDMTRLLRMLIKAERLGNWALHLKAVSQILPYLAASGHNLYAKSASMYLQSMVQLETEHPDVYQNFQSGYHVARRSIRTWAGLSTDLMIEQVLMRSLKTSGGLTRGRGMTEQQSYGCYNAGMCEVNRSMQELTGVKCSTSEQNKEMSTARQQRDMKYTRTLLMALRDRSPFDDSTTLRNLMTGSYK